MTSHKSTYTAPNGVVYRTGKQRRALCTVSAYRRTGRLAATETVYGMVDIPVSHPFAVGARLRVGHGRAAWTVIESHSTGVVVRSPAGLHRHFAYGALAHLHLLGKAGITQ